MSMPTVVSVTNSPHVLRDGRYRIPRYYQGEWEDGERVASPDAQVQKFFNQLRAASSLAEAERIVQHYHGRWTKDLGATRVALSFLDKRIAVHRDRKPVREDPTNIETFMPYYKAFNRWNTRLCDLKRARRPLLRKQDHLPARLFVLEVLKREASK